MNNSTAISTTLEASTNSTTQSFGLMNFVQLFLPGVNILFGVPANIYIIRLIVKGKGRGVSSAFFNLNLSICEIGISLHCLASMLARYFLSMLFFMVFLQGLILAGRTLFQCLMCVERYLAVVHPVTFLKFKPLRYRVICCSAAWIITLGSCFYSLFISISQNMYVQTWFFSVQFFLFFSIQLFCLAAVLRALKQSGPGERGREREVENNMKRRAFHLILITTVSMAFIYIPYTVTGFCIILTQQHNEAYWLPGLACYVLAGFVQPVLYLHRTGKLSCLSFS